MGVNKMPDVVLFSNNHQVKGNEKLLTIQEREVMFMTVVKLYCKKML